MWGEGVDDTNFFDRVFPSVTAAADVLRARGFDVIAMAGGFDAWRGLGLPVDVDGVVDDEEDDDGDPSTWN